MRLHIISRLSLCGVVALSACVKRAQDNAPLADKPQPDSAVDLPQGAVAELGLSEELLRNVYSRENLGLAQQQLSENKNFELNVLLRDDWREKVPLRVRSGLIKKHEELDGQDRVVGLGDLFIKSFITSTSAGDSLRRSGDIAKSSEARPFDLMKIELRSNTIVELIKALNQVHRIPGVIFAEPNFKVQKIAVPNDPSFPSLWGMTKIKANETWDSFTGAQESVVAVIDTGVDYRHEDLKDNIWINSREIPSNGIDDDGNGYVDDVNGWDFAYGDKDPMDGDSHGTHCSGTIAARGNNGLGVVGVNWKARIMPVKVLDDFGSGFNFDIYNGIIYAVTNGARVTSNSYGGGGASSLMASAIKTAQDRGVLFVAAAGNEAAAQASYPAYYTKTYTNVISVASTETNDNLSAFSNYGDGVDIAAPGRNILSTTPSNAYATLSGTSMATPHIAGVAALLWGAAPSKTMAQIRNAILTTVDSVPALAGKVAGSGRVNLKAAYSAVIVSPSPTPSPTVTPAPSPTVTPAPSPTVSPAPSPTVSPAPSPTVSPTPSPTTTPTPQPTPSPTPAFRDALRYRYYQGFWFRVPTFDAMRPVATGTTQEVSTSQAQRRNQFGFVFEGSFWIPKPGSYTFYLRSDDGSLLTINGRRVIDNDGLHGSRERSGTVNLTEGFHSIRVDYFQLFWGSSLNLQWSGPGLSRRKLGGPGVLFHQ